MRVVPSVLVTQLYLAFLALSCETECENAAESFKAEYRRGAAQISGCCMVYVAFGGIAKFTNKLMIVNDYNPYPHTTSNDITSLSLPWPLRCFAAFCVLLSGFIVYLVSLLGKNTKPSTTILFLVLPLAAGSLTFMMYETCRFKNWMDLKRGTASVNKDEDAIRERVKSINIRGELELGLTSISKTR